MASDQMRNALEDADRAQRHDEATWGRQGTGGGFDALAGAGEPSGSGLASSAPRSMPRTGRSSAMKEIRRIGQSRDL
jgi:hypothetical protein